MNVTATKAIPVITTANHAVALCIRTLSRPATEGSEVTNQAAPFQGSDDRCERKEKEESEGNICLVQCGNA